MSPDQKTSGWFNCLGRDTGREITKCVEESTMDLGLKGKKVILTGGSRGIGRAALEFFAAEGCDIAFFSRNAEQVAATVASLSRHGGKIIGEVFDLGDLAAYPAWLSSAADRLGGCDIFVPGASAS